jgi:hypothetical protein
MPALPSRFSDPAITIGTIRLQISSILLCERAGIANGQVNALAKAYHGRVKREQPVTCCTDCGGAGYNIRVANGRCCRTVAGLRCNGTNASALSNSDWEECSYCLATGYYRNKECPQCRGAGFLFIRPGWPVPLSA